MLKRRHYNIGNNFDCLLCETHVEEMVEHLFFHCTFSHVCWRILGFNWTQHNDRLKLIELAKKNHNRPMFMDIFLVAAWGLCKERNNNFFRGVSPTVASWKRRFISDFSNLSFRASEQKKRFIIAIVNSIV